MRLSYAIKRAQKRKQGVSLLVTIIFVTIFLLVIVGLGQSMLFSIRDIRDFSRHDELTSLARGAADLINQKINKAGRGGIGISGSRDIDCTGSPNPVATGIDLYAENLRGILCEPETTTHFSFSIEARPEAANAFPVGTETFYSLPLKGTGQAASRCDNIDDWNDPCHWNVISIGGTVEIPLFYYENNSVNDVGNLPSGSSSLQFQLRLRTPSPAPHENLFFDQTRPGHWQGDPTLVNWQIISESGTLKPNRDIETNRDLDTYGVRTTDNSEVYANKINTVSDHVVLNQSANGEEVNGVGQNINSFLTALGSDEHPILRLQLSAIPKKSSWIPAYQSSATYLDTRRESGLPSIVPYLEYQILVNNNNISDEKRIVRVTVTRGGISQTYEKTAYYGRVSAPTSLEDL